MQAPSLAHSAERAPVGVDVRFHMSVADKLFPWVASGAVAVVLFVATDAFLAWYRASSACELFPPSTSAETVRQVQESVKSQTGLVDFYPLGPSRVVTIRPALERPKGDHKFFSASFQGVHFQRRTCYVHVADGQVVDNRVR